MAAGDVIYSSQTILTLTGLSGLVSDGWWASGNVSNATSGYLDFYVSGRIDVNSAIGPDGSIQVYAFAAIEPSGLQLYTSGLGGVVRPGVVTWGTGCGMDGYLDLKHLGSASVDATDDGDKVEFGPFSIAQAFGLFPPAAFGLAIKNATGAAFDATGANNIVQWVGMKLATS